MPRRRKDLLRPSDQERILKRFHPDLRSLNCDILLPYLSQRGLLTADEYEDLINPLHTPTTKTNKLAVWLPKKGSKFLYKFIKCLRQSAEENPGIAHAELANKLHRAVDRQHAQRGTNGGFLTPLTIVFLLVLLTVIIAYVYPEYNVMYFFIVRLIHSTRLSYHSKTLPYTSYKFVGRENETNSILKLLDFTYSDSRLVSIDGPPGFGKSTLAVKVGHQMVDKGVTVIYVNMYEVSSMQVLAEKVIKGADIIAKETATTERMLKWAREVDSATLLILDNCDDLLHTQKDEFQTTVQNILESSLMIKILTTSRQKATLLDDSYEYVLHNLSLQSSSKLLELTTRDLDLATRETLADLTGGVPLALRIIGSLFNKVDPPSPNTVIKELRKQPIQTLSPEELPSQHQIEASFNLSYRYLHKYDQQCGQLLAFFPGSFDELAAVAVTQSSYTYICLRTLVQRSLLGFDQRSGRYEFHQLIKEYFVYKRASHGSTYVSRMFNSFYTAFQQHFAVKLIALTSRFAITPASALKALDSEKHNVNFFLTGIKYKITDPSNSAFVIEAVHVAINTKFLICRFSNEELATVLQSVTQYLWLYPEETGWNSEKLLGVYVGLLLSWAKFEGDLHDVSHVMWLLDRHKYQVERLYRRAEHKAAAVPYNKFYSRLSDYYGAMGYHDEVVLCQEKILLTMKALEDCTPGSCDYARIGLSYYRSGDYRRSAHYLELAMQHTQYYDVTMKVQYLTWLHNAYWQLGETAKVDEVMVEIVEKLPEVIRMDISMKDWDTLEQIAHFCASNEKMQEAAAVQERVLQLFREMHHLGDIRVAHYAVRLADLMKSIKNFSKAVEMGELALHILKTSGQDIESVTLNALDVIVTSKWSAGNWSELFKSVDMTDELIHEREYTSEKARNILTTTCLLRFWRFHITRVGCLAEVYRDMIENINHDFMEAVESAADPKETELSTSTEVARVGEVGFAATFIWHNLITNTGLLAVMEAYWNKVEELCTPADPYVAYGLSHMILPILLFVVFPLPPLCCLCCVCCCPCCICGICGCIDILSYVCVCYALERIYI